MSPGTPPSPLPEADWPAGGTAPSPTSRRADGSTSPPAPPQPMGPFILGDRSPTLPALSRAGAEGPRPPGLKFKLLVKKEEKKGVGTGRENVHSGTQCSTPPCPSTTMPPCPCLLNVGSAATAENNIPRPVDCPTFLSPLSVDEFPPTGPKLLFFMAFYCAFTLSCRAMLKSSHLNLLSFFPY